MPVRKSLVVGAVALAGITTLALFAASQTLPNSRIVREDLLFPVCPDPSWPPPVTDIVNIAGKVTVSGAGPSPVLYDVPLDQYLLVTDIEASFGGSVSASLVEVLAGAITVKRERSMLTTPHTPTTGIVFAPGSALALRHDAGPDDFVSYQLSGYLVGM